ncbi:hypothetical protein JO972_12140 [Verrucomicrobiaceae bacterium 5K15]|uniref:Methyltransferase domain-containing protein n=1 Tax=Oceaniferula flava TaxID=2800421 RepID=A0AAE2SD67_9BACT|nr:hypothetical protein [Oceaniferula flavus]MBK1855713.1 hypothetical protein [Oceaniferula flavus]MBM1137020.1 hypothetical protein [Oceaniferula flavus]
MKRIVEPEILDELPADDPAAVRSRRDLRMINALMGGPRWIVRQLEGLGDIERIVELGAGEGELSQQLKRSFPDSEVVAVDLIGKPDAVSAEVLWHQGNVLDYHGFDEYTVVVANLFIHHLKADALKLLGNRLADARAVILAEPHRVSSSLILGRTIFPLINHVTRHDMMTSIRAGFVPGEIPELFGGGFQWSESFSRLGGIRTMGVKP